MGHVYTHIRATFIPIRATFMLIWATFIPIRAMFIPIRATFMLIWATFIPIRATFMLIWATFILIRGRVYTHKGRVYTDKGHFAKREFDSQNGKSNLKFAKRGQSRFASDFKRGQIIAKHGVAWGPKTRLIQRETRFFFY
jgi:hypothetical protein